jgi:hypothetical protein
MTSREGAGNLPGDKQEPKTEDGNSKAPGPGSFAGNIRQLFRDVKAALTGNTPAPEPKPKRRDEETQGSLMMAARRFTRCIVQRQFRFPRRLPRPEA